MNARPRTVSTPAALILIILIGLAAFGRVSKFEFTTWDDDDTIAHNPKLNPVTAASIKSFWTQPQMELYIPVTYTVWAVAADAAKAPPPPQSQDTRSAPASASDMPPITLDPRVFHTLNLLFHLLSAWVVFLILKDLIEADVPALAGALLFLVHPVQVESVAWVSGMKDVLFGLLSLVAIWQYIRLAREEDSGGTVLDSEWWGRYAVATAAFILAMLSKPTAIVVPVAVIALDWLMVGRSIKTVLARTWPWLLLAVPGAILARWAQPTHDLTVAAWRTPLHWRPFVALDALSFYLYKLIWPATLSFDYGRTPQRVIALGWRGFTWLGPVVVLVLLILLRKRAKPIVVGAFIALLVLLPVLGFVPFEFQAYSTVADHYLYLAMLGPALAVAWVLSRRESALTIALAAIVVLALAVRTFNQTPNWRNSSALFDHARDVNPSSFASFNSQAGMAVDARQYGQAVDLATVAIQLNPSFFAAYVTRAGALARSGNVDGAIADSKKALELSPDHPMVLGNLAALLGTQGKFAEALPFARRSVEMDPDMLSARLNLAAIYVALNDDASARREIGWILEREPHNPGAEGLLTQLRTPSQPPP